jgi:transposase-like protein
MDTPTPERTLRREAIRRHVGGEKRCDICRDLDRSTRWFDKWRAEYEQNPSTDFADRSRAPTTSPSQTANEIVQAVVSVRRTLEAAATPATRYGLIGPRAVQTQLEGLGLQPPSLATIQRILQAYGLTHSIGAGNDSAFYPWLDAWAVNAIHATDIITRHIRGGEEIENFHTIDHYSHAAYLSQHTDKSSATTCAHLLATWSKLGLPQIQQFDNEDAFRGGHTHLRVIGRVVRLCLFCGLEVLFTPFYEAKRNHQIETFHSIWNQAFWSRQEFRNCAHVQAEVPLFEHWYHTVYRPPALQGKTPAQIRRGVPILRLTAELQRLIPSGRLPITAGQIHFMRKVETTGDVNLLNETWAVGSKWIGEYVCATVNTAEETLTFWHKRDAESDWQLLKTRQFRLKETVQPLLPAFRRNRARCREYLPG